MKSIIAAIIISLSLSASAQSFVIIEQIQASTVSYGCIDCGEVVVPNFWFVFNNGYYRYVDMEVSVVNGPETKSVAHPLGWASAWGPTPFLDSSRSPIWHIVINDQPFRTGNVTWSSTPKRVCSIGFSAITDCALDTAQTGYLFRINAWPKRDSLGPRDSSFMFSGSMFMYECSEVLNVINAGSDDTVVVSSGPDIYYMQGKVVVDVQDDTEWSIRIVDISANNIVETSGKGKKSIDFVASSGHYFIVFFMSGYSGVLVKSIVLIDR